MVVKGASGDRVVAPALPLSVTHVAELLLEDVVRADAQPDDVWLTLMDRGAELEEGTSVRRPGHLQGARYLLVCFDTQARTKTAHTQVGHELATGYPEEPLLFEREGLESR